VSAFAPILMSSAGASAPVKILLHESANWQAAPAYYIGLIVTVSTGATLTYTVQVTGDQIPSANGNWNAHDTLINQTASANSNVLFPVTGIRLNVISYTSGTVNLAITKWP
jgi:hypothetical protein